MSDLKASLLCIRGEILGMLETIEKVRGRQYGGSVHCLLLINQIARMMSLASDAVEQEQPQLAEVIREAVPQMLTELGLAVSRLTDFDNDHWRQIISDVDSIDNNVNRLASAAFHAAKSGGGFGDRNAA